MQNGCVTQAVTVAFCTTRIRNPPLVLYWIYRCSWCSRAFSSADLVDDFLNVIFASIFLLCAQTKCSFELTKVDFSLSFSASNNNTYDAYQTVLITGAKIVQKGVEFRWLKVVFTHAFTSGRLKMMSVSVDVNFLS